MFQSAWTIILTGVLTGLIGVVGYSYQKYVDRKSALVDLRRTTYSRYLALIANHASGNSSETNRELNKVYMELSVIASDEVVKAIGSFHDLSLGRKINNPNPKPIEELLAASILLMRKDCFENSKLTSAEITAVTPLVIEKK